MMNLVFLLVGMGAGIPIGLLIEQGRKRRMIYIKPDLSWPIGLEPIVSDNDLKRHTSDMVRYATAHERSNRIEYLNPDLNPTRPNPAPPSDSGGRS